MSELDATTSPLRAPLTTAGFVLAGTAWLFFQLGYTFESNDQVQYLLLPYREIYPHFLPGDWFTWSTSHYHLTFAWLVRALHAIGGDSGFRYAVLGAHLAGLAALSYAVLRLARSLGGGVLEAAAPLLVFGSVREFGLAGSIFNHGCLLPSDLALAPFLLACAASVEHRPRATGLWLGLAGFLHANFAVLGPAVLGPIALARALKTRQLRGFAELVGLYVLLAAPTLVLLAGSFLTKDSAPEAIAITLFVRSPHHYDLTAMQPLDFYWAGLLLLLSVPAWTGPFVLPARTERAQLVLLLAALVGVGIVAAWLRIVPLSRLFMFRLSVPLYILLLLSAAHVARSAVLRRDVAAMLWACTSLAVLAMFAREDLLTLVPWREPPQILDPSAVPQLGWLHAGVLGPLALATLLLIGSRGFAAAGMRRVIALGLLLALPLVFSLWVARIPIGQVWTGLRFRQARSAHLLDRRIELAPPDRELYRQARALTPADARFLIAPGMFQFRFLARRSIFVDWKCAPMKGDEALEWKRRMLAAMGASDFPARGYELPARADALYYARPVAELQALARQEGMTHLIIRRSQLKKRDAGQIVFSSGSFVVLAVAPAQAAPPGS